MSETNKTQPDQQTIDKTTNTVVYKWYQFSKEKGRYLLGLVIAVVAYGVYTATPPALLAFDHKADGHYIRCTSAFTSSDVKFDPSPCRYYFEEYLPERIRMTNSLPNSIPLDVIGNTYQLVQTRLKADGFAPMSDIETLSNNTLKILDSGKIVIQTQ